MVETTIEYDVLAPLAALIAILAGLWQYRRTAREEFLKPIREAQLNLYQQASDAAALLATLKIDSDNWKKAHEDFHRLFYGSLCIVENFEHSEITTYRMKIRSYVREATTNFVKLLYSSDRTVVKKTQNVTVEQAMVAFQLCLNRRDDSKLRDLSLGLAHTCRVSLGKDWNVEVPQLDGKYQKLIEDYLVLHQKPGVF
jgi:hypothetical protein